jgi:hypothetical protein
MSFSLSRASFFGATFLDARGSLGENPAQTWASDGGTFGVVPSLEALSLETEHGLLHCHSIGFPASFGVSNSVLRH